MHANPPVGRFKQEVRLLDAIVTHILVHAANEVCPLLRFGYKFLSFGGNLSQTASVIAIALGMMPDAILDLGEGPLRVHSILEEVHQGCVLPYLAVIENRKVDIGIVPHHWRWRISLSLYLRILSLVKVCSDGIILVNINILASHHGKARGDGGNVSNVINVIHSSICRIMVTRQRIS
jgi:hypothetical protein